MMGFWFLSSAIANYAAGRLPALLSYFDMDLFFFLTLSSLFAGFILFFMAPFLERLIYKKWEKNLQKKIFHESSKWHGRIERRLMQSTEIMV